VPQSQPVTWSLSRCPSRSLGMHRKQQTISSIVSVFKVRMQLAWLHLLASSVDPYESVTPRGSDSTPNP
jgi:hypothetical protein